MNFKESEIIEDFSSRMKGNVKVGTDDRLINLRDVSYMTALDFPNILRIDVEFVDLITRKNLKVSIGTKIEEYNFEETYNLFVEEAEKELKKSVYKLGDILRENTEKVMNKNYEKEFNALEERLVHLSKNGYTETTIDSIIIPLGYLEKWAKKNKIYRYGIITDGATGKQTGITIGW